MADVDRAYDDLGFAMQSRWFGTLFLLHQNGPMHVSALAAELGQTHSAVSQLSKKLEQEGWVCSEPDPRDSRRRVLRLSDAGPARIKALEPVWRSMVAAVHLVLQDADASALLAVVGRLERALDDTPLREVILAHHKKNRALDVRVGALHHEFVGDEAAQVRTAFRTLNAAWLEKYFYIEEHDDKVLRDPEHHIIATGGFVFAAFLDGEVVGVGALMPHGREMELTKMAVAPSAQGLGIGERLVERAIETWRSSTSETLFLESNARLKPALKLYEKTGFIRQATRRPGSKYTRSDVYMVFGGARA